MTTLSQAAENIKFDQTKIGETAPKLRLMSDIVSTNGETLADYQKKQELIAPEWKSETNVRLHRGFADNMRQLMYTPEGIEIMGGQAEMALGGLFGSETMVNRGKTLIQSANRDLDLKLKQAEKDHFPLSSADYDSLSYMLGSGAANYGVMLAVSYLSGGTASTLGVAQKTAQGITAGVGIATMGVMEATGETQEGLAIYKKRTGDTNLENIDPAWAGKEIGTTAIYTAGSAIIEKKFGFGQQTKLARTPMAAAKQIGLQAASEGGTETLQEGLNIAIDYFDDTLDDTSARLRGAVMEGVVGSILGGASGTAAAISHRAQAKALIKDQLQNVIPEGDLENVVNAVYKNGSEKIADIITTELTLSSELRAKHGEVYDAVLNGITEQVNNVGAFTDVDEDEKAQYIAETAKMFADQTLAEATKRNCLIDEVIKASDIGFYDGKLRLKFASDPKAPQKPINDKNISIYEAIVNPKVLRGMKRADKGKTLIQFLHERGGLTDVGGDLRTMDAHKLRIGLINNKSGSSLDDMTLAAWEHGYFPNKTERPEIQDLLDAISDELLGNRHYAGKVEKNFVDEVDDFREQLSMAGINYAGMTAEELESTWNDFVDNYNRENVDNVAQSMYKSPLATFGEFYDDVMSGENPKARFYTVVVDDVALDIPSNTVEHDANKHGLSKQEWESIISALGNSGISETEFGNYSRMNGIPVKMVVNVKGVEYGVVFEHMTSGRNLVQSAFILEDKGWINKNAQTAASDPQPKSRRLGRSMTDIITRIAEIVNAEEDNLGMKLSQNDSFITGQKNSKVNQTLKSGIGKVVRGSYSVSEKAIEITQNADFSTLPHEMAHFWLDNMWEYVRSGNASEAYQAQFKTVAGWLGMTKGQTYITRGQHEKFARGYEKYLLNGELPTPIIKGTFDSYDKWLKKVYKDANNLHVRLSTDAVRFFQSMTTGELPSPSVMTIPAKNEVVKKQIELEDKQAKRDIEIITRPQAVAPVVSNITTGTTGKSAVYTKAMDRAAQLMQGELTELEYNKVNLKEQSQRAVDFVAENLLDAREVAYGRKAAPEGILDTAVRIAYEEAMLSQGNINEYLSVLKLHSAAQTIRGQEISAERIGRDDISSPKFWHDKLSLNKRQAVAEKIIGRTGKITVKNKNIDYKSPVAQLNDIIKNRVNELTKLVLQAKTAEEQQKIMQDFAKRMKKEYRLDAIPETLNQELITPENVREITLAFLEDTFGTGISEKEMAEIVAHTDNVKKSLDTTMDSTGNPSVQTVALYDRLNKDIEAKTPSNPMAIATSVIGRSMMLASIKSPILNIASNVETLVTEGVANRIAMSLTGNSTVNLVDEDVKRNYIRYGIELYNASGYNASTTENNNFETRIRGEKILTTQGEGRFRAFARMLETGIFKYSMGFPDSVSKDIGFVDYVGLEASKIGKTKEKATEIFKDAILFEPKTEVGREIRKRGISYAHKVTFTNNSVASQISLAIRNVFNMASGDLRLGDQLMPFVKTPANVISIAAEYQAGILYAIPHLQTIINDVKSGMISETTQNCIQAATRNGFGAVLAALIAYAFDPDDYIPEYEALTPSERTMYQAQNTVYNSVKIGNKYVSLDYFGPLGSVLSGIMAARREKSAGEAALAYIKNTASQFKKLPGVKELKEFYDDWTRYTSQTGDKTWSDLQAATANYVMSRTIPSIVSDIAKAMDDFERDTNRSVLNTFKSKIPLLRETLAPKMSNLTGQPIETENALLVMLAGSRIKTAVESEVADEVNRLFKEGERPSLTDVTRYGKLKTLTDDEKLDVRRKFAGRFVREVQKLIRTNSYMRADNSDKKDMINKIRKIVSNDLKKEYRIK